MNIHDYLKKMTLNEKVGQLNLGVGDLFHTGPTGTKGREEEAVRTKDFIRKGLMGGLVNVKNIRYVQSIQKIAVEESRLGIPLLFGVDVIHGCFTQYPIPLAEACSWDLNLIEKSAVLAAKEASATGIHWTFAPMVDITRDPRWGRIAEGSGEDPYLGSVIAKARVRGFEQGDLKNPETLASCAKHFIAYGWSEAGREYNTVDCSERLLRSIILPPFQACIEENCATVMSSFNSWEGRPVSAHRYLLDTILRQELQFQGMVVSDWQSTIETIPYRVASDRKESTQMCLSAGVDMEMMGEGYVDFVETLIEEGKLSLQILDQAVLRVLQLKEKLGLFEDPYRQTSEEREKKIFALQDFSDHAYDIGIRSPVLLENSCQTLPLSEKSQFLLTGALSYRNDFLNGTWSCFGEERLPISLKDTFEENHLDFKFLPGVSVDCHEDDDRLLQEVLDAVDSVEYVICVVGESPHMSGESGSRTKLDLPGKQELMVQKLIQKAPEKLVLIVLTGRPFISDFWSCLEKRPPLLWSGHLGYQTGTVLYDLLFGHVNPSGHLPITFPRTMGQIPIYYNAPPVGRPVEEDTTLPKVFPPYTSRYIDEKNSPLYPFGYGLSYSRFVLSNLNLSSQELTPETTLNISCDIELVGGYPLGRQLVQLFLSDEQASATRPMIELKRFQLVELELGKKQTIHFSLTTEDCCFYRYSEDPQVSYSQRWGFEPGDFSIQIASYAGDPEALKSSFTLRESI